MKSTNTFQTIEQKCLVQFSSAEQGRLDVPAGLCGMSLPVCVSTYQAFGGFVDSKTNVERGPTYPSNVSLLF